MAAGPDCPVCRYQAASGAGAPGMDELKNGAREVPHRLSLPALSPHTAAPDPLLLAFLRSLPPLSSVSALSASLALFPCLPVSLVPPSALALPFSVSSLPLALYPPLLFLLPLTHSLPASRRSCALLTRAAPCRRWPTVRRGRLRRTKSSRTPCPSTSSPTSTCSKYVGSRSGEGDSGGERREKVVREREEKKRLTRERGRGREVAAKRKGRG